MRTKFNSTQEAFDFVFKKLADHDEMIWGHFATIHAQRTLIVVLRSLLEANDLLTKQQWRAVIESAAESTEASASGAETEGQRWVFLKIAEEIRSFLEDEPKRPTFNVIPGGKHL